MCAAQTDAGLILGKWSLIALGIIGAILAVASIWSLSSALRDSSGETWAQSSLPFASVPAPAAEAPDAILRQEEIARHHGDGQQMNEPAFAASAPESAAVVPTKAESDAVILRQEKARYNRLYVERMRQYVKDHPNLNTRELVEQIEQREKRAAKIE